jgi:hypothetical protein
MNKYDLEHACTGHPRMSKAAWEGVYRDAWARYYTDAHVETIMRRAIVSGINRTKMLDSLVAFSGSAVIEGVHPLQFGFVRRKMRTQRRSGLPIVNPLIFYPWRVVDFMTVLGKWARRVLRYRGIMKRVKNDPASATYTDLALTPIVAGAEDHFVQHYVDKLPHTHGAPVKHEDPAREIIAAE